jgi:hypothetical protein
MKGDRWGIDVVPTMIGHNPGGDQRLDISACSSFGDGTYRIKGRPLFEMEDHWNDPACQESESHKDAEEHEQAPTGAQAPGVEEKFPHVVGTLVEVFVP